MSDLWFNILLELGLLVLLGVLYYFYQRNKILKYEADKGPYLMGYILQCCLSERGEDEISELDPLIESIDDYLHNRAATPPTALIKTYITHEKGSVELRNVMKEALSELGEDGKK